VHGTTIKKSIKIIRRNYEKCQAKQFFFRSEEVVDIFTDLVGHENVISTANFTYI
jgi:hypothetical protein